MIYDTQKEWLNKWCVMIYAGCHGYLVYVGCPSLLPSGVFPALHFFFCLDKLLKWAARDFWKDQEGLQIHLLFQNLSNH